MSYAEEKVFTIPELRLIILSYAWEPKKKKNKWFKKCRFNKINVIKCFLKCFGFNSIYIGRI